MAFRVPRWITANVGANALLAGKAYDYLTPGKGSSTLTNAGTAAVDPNKVYSGSLNPYTAVTDNKPGFTSVLGASTNGQTGNGNTTQDTTGTKTDPTTTYGSGGGTGAGATIDRNGLLATLQQKWTTLGGVLNDIYGNIDAVVRDRANGLNDNYANQENQIAKDYSNVSGQTANAYAGRGLADSSYLGEAQDANTNTYNSTVNALNQDKTANYAKLGEYATTQKAGVDAVRQQYEPMMANVDQYDNTGLQSIDTGLNDSLATANNTRAGLGTNSDFIQKLNAITPVQQQGSAQLQTRLQNLIGSTAPTNAKRQIAKGLIKAATLSDPSQAEYWNQQFEALLANGGQ